MKKPPQIPMAQADSGHVEFARCFAGGLGALIEPRAAVMEEGPRRACP